LEGSERSEHLIHRAVTPEGSLDRATISGSRRRIQAIHPMNALGRRSSAVTLNATGLVLTAAGMLVQIAAGSTLYPSVTGPIVLLAAAAFVAFGPDRWTPYVGLLVPLVLGVGAIIAAVMTGAFINQLADIGRAGIFAGSLMHVIGLIAALAGSVGMVQRRRVIAA
jgi:hypothetical protein